MSHPVPSRSFEPPICLSLNVAWLVCASMTRQMRPSGIFLIGRIRTDEPSVVRQPLRMPMNLCWDIMPPKLRIKRAGLAEDEEFLILIFIYSEAKRQDKTLPRNAPSLSHRVYLCVSLKQCAA
uniref:Uncharacterized protein n=1 Tax=Moniliophthora roreri TaxID=221103 RepID=A0A0W0G8F2_MONRR